MSQQTYHFLYIDSNPVCRKEITDEFNKPEIISDFHKDYIVKITAIADFRAAMTRLLLSNLDFIRQQYIEEFKISVESFHSIIFEVTERQTKRYNWRSFLRDCQLIGFSRLSLNQGLITTGMSDTFSPCMIEFLMKYHVTRLIKRPFSHEQFKDTIKNYLDAVRGSTYFTIERQFETDSEKNKDIVRRLARFYGENQEERTLSLDILEFDPVTFITRSLSDPFDFDEDTMLQQESSY